MISTSCRRLSAVLAVAIAISGCVSTTGAASPDANGNLVSLCEMSDDFDSYLEMQVEVEAGYVSDGRHEEVLEDVSCAGGRRIIDVGRRAQTASVDAFYTERKRICEERRAAYLCNTRADVRVVGTVGLMAGHYVLNIEEVEEFSFFK